MSGVAVLFRDSDGTASADRGLWQDKWNSIIQGFSDEEFECGVPMIPKPKSEAWIICSVKENPYQGCGALESRSGNDNSPNSLKRELAEILDGRPSREQLCEMVNNGTTCMLQRENHARQQVGTHENRSRRLNDKR
jgi:hypothetical protein